MENLKIEHKRNYSMLLIQCLTEVLRFALSLLIVDSLVLLNRELLVAKLTADKQINGLLNIVNEVKI
jgi:hypothetical protein